MRDEMIDIARELRESGMKLDAMYSAIPRPDGGSPRSSQKQYSEVGIANHLIQMQLELGGQGYGFMGRSLQ